MRKLVIVGAGGLGREVGSWALDAAGRGADWEPVGYLDDNAGALTGRSMPLPVLGGILGFAWEEGMVVVVAIGLPGVRRRISEDLARRGCRFGRLVHPTAVVARGAMLGDGVILAPYAVASADARIGDGVVANMHSVVQHEAEIGAWSQLNSHADVGGGALLGSEVLVRTGGMVPARMRVPDGSVIGMGCVFGEAVGEKGRGGAR